MRKLLTILLIISCLNIQAKNYYFSSSSGVDSRTTTEAQDPSTPWRTIAKLNSFFPSLVAGDFVYFKRGDVFYGGIIAARNGGTGLPITISAYGTGAKPIVSGFSDITSWTNVGTNLWRAAVPAGSPVQMVVINGQVARIGRTPNYGWLTYESHNGNLSFTDNELVNFPNYTGAFAVFRSLHDQASKVRVNSHVGATINYDSIVKPAYRPIDGAGWFAEGALSCVDTANEWYMDEAARLITIYSIGSPTSVKVSTKDTIFAINQWDNITIDGLAIEGGNQYGVTAGNQKTGQSINPTIKNSDINFSGIDGIYMTWNTGALITGNTISNSLNIGIEMENEGGQSDNSTITRNLINKSGMIVGMGLKYSAVTVWGANCLFQYNDIDSTGHTGFSGYFNDVRVLNNKINHYCMTVDDAGAINFFDPSFGATIHTGREVRNNIILNGAYGVGAGTPDGADVTIGVYGDDEAKNIVVDGNFISGVPRSGFYIHNGTNITFTNNTVFNAGESQAALVHDNHAIGHPLRNIIFKKNLLFARTGTPLILQIRSRQNDIASIFTPLDSNQYARPSLTTGNTIKTTTLYQVTGAKDSSYTLSAWNARQGYDGHTLATAANAGTPVAYENFSDTIRRVYFPGLKMIDAYGTNYDHQTTVNPYSGIILMPNGFVTTQPPTANAGDDQSVTLPTSSTTLNGSGTDPDGTIVSYAWVKVSGPAGGAITSPSSASTGITGLQQGNYVFGLTVTDNSGATGTDAMQVSVFAANIPPVVNAGTDQTITLPVSSVNFTATASDVDGTISTILWTKVSGPAGGTIANSSSLTTGIFTLQQGAYVFKVKVTDNAGDTAVDFIQVNVNPAVAPINDPPTAEAGPNQNITLPTSSVNLSGSGTDPDGTITGYAWLKTSGPAGGTVTSPTSQNTTITGLQQGTYTFQLTVTDNGALTGTDLVVITVNAANIPPTAAAGGDQIITLPTSSATLTGSGTDLDGTISGYLWTKISGPTGGAITSSTSASTGITSLVQGDYIYQLRVTDNAGDTATDFVQITVNAAPANIPPIANAGNDTTIYTPATSVTLVGSGSDQDGTISSYAWTLTSGPGGSSFGTPNAATTTFTGLVQGVYVARLTVTDNSSGTGYKEASITVAAGAAQIILIRAKP